MTRITTKYPYDRNIYDDWLEELTRKDWFKGYGDILLQPNKYKIGFTSTNTEWRKFSEPDGGETYIYDLPGVDPASIVVSIDNSNLQVSYTDDRGTSKIDKVMILGDLDYPSAKATLKYGRLTVKLERKKVDSRTIPVTLV